MTDYTVVELWDAVARARKKKGDIEGAKRARAAAASYRETARMKKAVARRHGERKYLY